MTLTATPNLRHDLLTYKGNLKKARYGWIRLTPAYSVHLVEQLINEGTKGDGRVLDPFCGTGTSALLCAEKGIAADTTDINPFLVWLATVKTRAYNESDILNFFEAANSITATLRSTRNGSDSGLAWAPNLHQLEKWWAPDILVLLSRTWSEIRRTESSSRVVSDLLKVVFCRVLIDHANVSFSHQSMSFKKPLDQDLLLPLETSPKSQFIDSWKQSMRLIGEAAASPIEREPDVHLLDARDLSKLPANGFTAVITSPPYPNRMSYIRELRPYMYWLRFLNDGRQAGELDWQAIGGTWGRATSNLGKWTPNGSRPIPFKGFDKILGGIGLKSALLSKYVHKYFVDTTAHLESLYRVVAPGGGVSYIVGNSKFYDVMLPVEKIYAGILSSVGFKDVGIQTIRKRTSKKELFEFLVVGKKPRR